MSKAITSISVDGGVLSTPSSPWLAITGCSEPSQEKFIPEVLAWLRSCIKEVIHPEMPILRAAVYSVRFDASIPMGISLIYNAGDSGFPLYNATQSSTILGKYNLWGKVVCVFGDFSEIPSFISHPDFSLGTEYFVEFNADCPTPILDICGHLGIY